MAINVSESNKLRLHNWSPLVVTHDNIIKYLGSKCSMILFLNSALIFFNLQFPWSEQLLLFQKPLNNHLANCVSWYKIIFAHQWWARALPCSHAWIINWCFKELCVKAQWQTVLYCLSYIASHWQSCSAWVVLLTERGFFRLAVLNEDQILFLLLLLVVTDTHE